MIFVQTPFESWISRCKNFFAKRANSFDHLRLFLSSFFSFCFVPRAKWFFLNGLCKFLNDQATFWSFQSYMKVLFAMVIYSCGFAV